MISFENAIEIATQKTKKLIPQSRNISLEGIMISEDESRYEISLSYEVHHQDSDKTSSQEQAGLAQLAQVLRYRRQEKTFLVDSQTGQFKGFKNTVNG